MATLFDYDLNIFQREEEFFNEETHETYYDYVGPWYIDVYEVNPPGHQHVAGPFELTDLESRMLGLGTGYFDEPDCWYGLDGFLVDYADSIHPRISALLNSFPKVKEEVLF